MDFRDSPEEAKFRQELREWLATQGDLENWEDYWGDIPKHMSLLREWTRRLDERGYHALTWPVEQGGQGLSQVYTTILNQEISRSNAPQYPPMINFVGRMIAVHGTEEQRERFIPSMFNGDVLWCQGFSEPGAGSDLANLSTRAVLDGDRWIVNGQKLWGNTAHAEWCFLLVRTEEDKPRHRGLSMLLLDMSTPGLVARPVALSNGELEMGELFFTDVEVPAENLLGSRGDGWQIAMSTFTFERNPVENGFVAQLERRLRALDELAAEMGVADDPSIRERLARCYVGLQGLQYHGLEQLSALLSSTTGMPGEESSVGKLLWAHVGQDMEHVAMDILGARALLPDDPAAEQEVKDYLWSRVLSIFGGSGQIQRNILAWRVLGLPR